MIKNDIQRRSKTEADESYQQSNELKQKHQNKIQALSEIKILNDGIKEMNLRYHSIKIIQGVYQIIHMIQKYKSMKVQTYFWYIYTSQMIKNIEKPLQNVKLLDIKYAQFVKIYDNILKSNKKRMFQKLILQMRKQKLIIKVYLRLKTKLNLIQYQTLSDLFQQKSIYNDDDFLDYIECKEYNKEIENNSKCNIKEKLAIKFAATTQIIFQINKLLQKNEISVYALIYQYRLDNFELVECKQSKQINIQNSIDNDNRLIKGCLLLKKTFNKKINIYLKNIKIKNHSSKSFKNSLMNSLHNVPIKSQEILIKLFRKVESESNFSQHIEDLNITKSIQISPTQSMVKSNKSFCYLQQNEQKNVSIIQEEQEQFNSTINLIKSVKQEQKIISKLESVFLIIIYIIYFLIVLQVSNQFSFDKFM